MFAAEDATDTGSATVPAIQTGSVVVEKTADQASYAAVGDVLTYGFKVTNTGNVTLTNLTVSDPSSVVTGGPIASLAPGAVDSTTLTASHVVTQADIDAGSFTNTATVTGTLPSGLPVQDTDSATVPGPVSGPSITVLKSADQASYVSPGDVLTYTITVENNGNVTLTNLTMSDLSSVVTGGPIATLAPGASDSTTFTASHVVTQADIDAGSFTNTATVTGTPPSGPAVTATGSATVPAIQTGSVVVEKTAEQASYASPGDVLTYTITVTNTGNVTLTNLTVSDPSAVVTGGPIASLAPGAVDSTTFTASHVVTQADIDAGSFTNTATVTGTLPSGLAETDTDSATVPAIQTASVVVEKTADQASYAAPGDVLTYTITVTNTGNVTLTNLTLSDPSSVVTGGPIATLAPGASDSTTFTASHVVTPADIGAGSFTNTATVAGTPPSGPAVTDTDSATVPGPVPGPSIAVLKSVDQSSYASPGDVLTYTITVENNGNVTLTNVTVTDPWATVIGGPIASLAPGAVDSTTFTASHVVTQADMDAGSFTNTATVTGTPPSGPAVTATGSATVPRSVFGPSIAVLKSANQSSYASLGDVLTYTITVANNGNVTLTNVTVSDPSSVVTGGPIATLAPGASDSTTFTANHEVTQADIDAGSFTNTATVTGTPPSGPAVTATDSATVRGSVLGPSIAVLKSADQSSYASLGDVLTYTITVANNGNVTLTNVTVSDPSSVVTGGPIAALAPGASDSTTFTASHEVTQADIDAGSFTNTATVTGTPPAGPAVTDTDSATVPGSVLAPSVAVLKSADQSSYASPGDVLTYTITVANNGNVMLTNVTVSDPSAVVTGGPIASLAPGAVDSTTFTASHEVTQADMDAGSFTNTATVTGTPPSGPAVTATGSATVPGPVLAPSVAVLKSADQSSYASPGDVLTYTITVANNGNATLTDVTVSDPSSVVTGGPIASLVPGAVDSTTFTASHVVTQADIDAGNFTNTATVTGTPPSGPVVTDTVSATVPAIQTNSVVVAKTADQASYAAVGDVLTYRFTVMNKGNVTLTNLTVSDSSAVVTGGPIATLAPRALDSTTFTASHVVTQADIDAGSFTNTATVTGTPPSGSAVTDTDSATVPGPVLGPSIAVLKTAHQSSYTSPGDVLTYTITVANNGNVTLINVTVSDPSAVVTGGPIASLVPGAVDSTTFEASHVVTQADVDAGSFTNTVTVTGTPYGNGDIGTWSQCVVTPNPDCIGQAGATVEIHYTGTPPTLYLVPQGIGPNESDYRIYVNPIPLEERSNGVYGGVVPPLTTDHFSDRLIEGAATFVLQPRSQSTALDDSHIQGQARMGRHVVIDTIAPIVGNADYKLDAGVLWTGSTKPSFGAADALMSGSFPYPGPGDFPQMAVLEAVGAVFAPYGINPPREWPKYIYNVGSISNGYATGNDWLNLTITARYIDPDVYTALGLEAGEPRTPTGFTGVNLDTGTAVDYFTEIWSDSGLPAAWLLQSSDSAFLTMASAKIDATTPAADEMTVIWTVDIPVVGPGGPLVDRLDLIGDFVAVDKAGNVTRKSADVPPLQISWRSGRDIRVDMRTRMYGAWPEVSWSLNDSGLGINRANESNPQPLYTYGVWGCRSYGLYPGDNLYVPLLGGWSGWTTDTGLSATYFDQIVNNAADPIADRWLIVAVGGCDEAGNITPWDSASLPFIGSNIFLQVPETSGTNWIRFYVPGKTTQIDTLLYANLFYVGSKTGRRDLGPAPIVGYPAPGSTLFAEFNARMLINDPALWASSPYVRVTIERDGVSVFPLGFEIFQADGSDMVYFQVPQPVGDPSNVVSYSVSAATTVLDELFDQTPAAFSFSVVPGAVDDYLRSGGGQQPVKQFENR